ncbi:MAG: D-tyrosyl-tRNA(Tyr) deacylase [Caldithrix sp.]|nr:D-tyrosyl-tRNA(Tyr) deacylase [Caldithrix sp.]
MKVLLQRVSEASVKVDQERVGRISRGLLLLVGISEQDTEEDVQFVAHKCVNLRIFEDDHGKMNRSLLESGGEILAISQFTLMGDTRKGRRPSFVRAASPEKGRLLYESFIEKLKNYDVNVQTGIFGAMMDVQLVNYGPVTVMVESKNESQ